MGSVTADAWLRATCGLGVGVNARRGTDGFNPIKEALRSGRSCPSASGSRDGFTPFCVHGLWKPSIGSSVDDLCGSTDRAIFVQRDVVGNLDGMSVWEVERTGRV